MVLMPQLVSLFTICDDIAVYTGGGGQCDLTNSNSSFGTKGLVSQGLGDQTSKIVESLYWPYKFSYRSSSR